MTIHAHADGAAEWAQSAPLLALVAILAGAYVLGATRAPRGWSRWRTASWLAACAVLAIAVSPLLAVDTTAIEHMAQHLLLGMIAPLGLVLAAPITLVLRVAPRRARRTIARVLHLRAFRVVGHPITAAVLSTGGLFVVMLTPVYAVAESNSAVHYALHLHFLVAGYLFAWAIAGPDPAPGRPSMPVRTAVLVGAAGAHAFLAKYLYAHAADLPPDASWGIAEVQDAAQLMYYGGDLAELLLAVALFSGWYARRGRQLMRTSPASVPQSA